MADNQPDRGQRGLPGGKPRYSAFAVAKNSMSNHQDWQRAWRDAEPKSEYDAVIIGGGGHGLATAYYLVAVHCLLIILELIPFLYLHCFLLDLVYVI